MYNVTSYQCGCYNQDCCSGLGCCSGSYTICGTCYRTNNAGAEGYPSNNSASVLINTYSPTPLPTAPAPPFPTLTATPAPGSTANDIYLSKGITTPNAAFVAKGASISYAMDVSLPSTSNRVAFATFLDTLPAQVLSPTWTCSVVSAGTPVSNGPATSCGTYSGSGSINTNIILEPGSKLRFAVSGTVSASASGDIINTAQLFNVNLAYYTSAQCGCYNQDCCSGIGCCSGSYTICNTCWTATYTGIDTNTANNVMTIGASTY